MEQWVRSIRNCRNGLRNLGKPILSNKQKQYILDNLKGEKLEDVLKDWEIVETKKTNFNTIPSTPDEVSNIDRGPQFRIRYKYSGIQDEKNRSFCSELLSRNELYRKEDIEQMQNDDFTSYNIFLFSGSYNCRHNWESVVLRQKKDKQGEPITDEKITDGVPLKDEGGVIEIDKRPERQKLIDNRKSDSIKDILKPKTIKETNELNNLLDSLFIQRSVAGRNKLLETVSKTQKEQIEQILEGELI